MKTKNKVQVVSKFNRSIRFNLVRFGAKDFGFVCAQTGKRMYFKYDTRFQAGVGFARRYNADVYPDCAYVNPISVASLFGFDMAFELLTAAGFVAVKNGQAVVVEQFDMGKNQ